MAQSIILILLCFIDSCDTQWQTNQNYLSSNQIFTDQTEDFVLPFSTTQAQFITCTTPATSYMTLNSTKPSANYLKKQFYFDGSFINFDLFFQGTWSNEFIIFTIGDTFLYKYLYISPQNYPITQGFCDNLIVDVKSINFTLTNTIQDKIQFTSTGQGDAQVSIKNVIVSRHICFPSCSSCTGPKFNQCTNCYYGSVTNNICPPCSSNQYYMKYQGCKDICDIYSPIVYKGFCQSYPISKIFSFEFQSSNPLHPENMKWSIIYDLLNIDASPKPQQINRYLYGIFKFNSGIYRFFNQLSTYSFSTYLIGLKISILLFYDIPLNCGIQFKINDVYSGSIYRNASGIQTHKLKIFQTQLYDSYLNYSLRKSYDLITYLNIPKSQIVFSAIGNYTDDTAGWGMVSIEFTSGYCPQYCNLCEVSFKCKTCQNGYYMYRDGSCISNCSSSYQKLIDLYCYDYDDETPYSQYLIQEYTNLATDPDQYQQYTLIFQEGSNFLKGLDIYYSYWQEYRVFGGPFVWAQAKFQRIHEIIDPHHSITIGFYIIYGPQFPSDGGFIYTIQNNTPVTKSSSAYHSLYSDGSKDDKIYERIVHNTNNLIISWECFGKNNEPVYAYCGFYNYYIAVHYCQPYCLSCQDQNKCTLWNSSYDSKIVRFSQEECLNTQYFDRDSFQCLQCLLPCLTCKSKIDCLTCVSTYTKTKLGCICKINQYEDKNQCFNCPNECNQCLSQTYCIECLISNNRKLINGQCNCIDGYYSIISNPQCQLCDQFCKTCFGPTFNDCLTCSYYDDALRTCSQCHQSCLTCYKNTINSCLTCNPTLNRILKGLVCECAPGYYDLNNICANCPINEDKTLNQCYKYCNNNQSIWYSIICNSCDPGFQLISGECQPICGDLQIKGYEQCDNNSNLIDLCYNCQFKCPIHCQTCNETTTLPCPDICGDGIITGIEECEDGNTIQYDGCFDCKYQCQPECTKCIKGECFECANRGQYISQQLLHGYAKINVEIQSKLEMNNVKITIKMIQMDAKIVNIIVELVVPLVIITQKLVQVVNYLGLLLMNIIVKIFVEMGQLLLILMDFIKNNVMMEIQLIMMVTLNMCLRILPFKIQNLQSSVLNQQYIALQRMLKLLIILLGFLSYL
ncbi:unnamed protein product [Paramecium sonneborni]|uniref:EGF-like domain-containing protein n=1 Tax=Paramecium sonneborni TaxID=65129 RepID=A0A8S1MBW5_9CILI|nr:unnamed protein product [Paramecium sonneborni]